MTFFDSGSQPYFCANSSTHGANKKIPRPLVACFPGFNCSPDFCDCHTLGMADPDPALPDYGVSESDGYHVGESNLIEYRDRLSAGFFVGGWKLEVEPERTKTLNKLECWPR